MVPTMPLHAWLTLVSCVGQLALAGLSVARAGVSPLAVPLAWLAVSLFSWNFATLAHAVSGDAEWRILDVAASPLTIPCTLGFIVTFVGRRKELRGLLAGAFVLFGLLGVYCMAGLWWSPARRFAGSPLWAAMTLTGALAIVAYSIRLLAEHYEAEASAEERVRTRLVVSALVVGGVLNVTELLADLGLGVPRGGNLGALAAASVLAIVALRFRLLERELPLRMLSYSLALGALAVAAYLGVFYLLLAHTAAVVVGTVTVTLALLAGLRQVLSTQALERARLERLCVLGRFSAQMAHDLRNPIAAMKGAVQYLEEHVARGGDLVSQREFLALLAEQIDRVGGVVDRYHRLGRLEVVRESSSIAELVSGIVRAQGFPANTGAHIDGELAAGLPPCSVDRDLVGRAVENLVQNAREASPPKTRITVRTESAALADGRPAVAVVVRDQGVGIDPRTLERVFEEFFTTKAQGSGLGLAFVKRVAEAHGGDATIASRVGHGTEVRLLLPAN